MINNVLSNTSAALLAASATSLTTATAKNIPVVTPTGVTQPVASALFLNAGRWQISGSISFILASTTTASDLAGGFSTTTGTLPNSDNGLTRIVAAFTAGAPTTNKLVLDEITVDVGANGANFFLVAQAAFAVSTLTAFGTITAVQLAP